MRFFQQLDTITRDAADDSLVISCQAEPVCMVALWFGREGLYTAISANYGPLEIALRLRRDTLGKTLAELRPLPRLAALRTLGTGRVSLEFGLSTEGELLLRITLTADATGYFAMNLMLTSAVRAQLFAWLDVPEPAFE